MRKLYFLLIVLLWAGTGRAQSDGNPELIANGYYETFGDKNFYGHSYGLITRLMIGSDNFRFGPYFDIGQAYTRTGDKYVGDRYYYIERPISFGASIDRWHEGDFINTYWELSAAYRWGMFHGGDGKFEHIQDTRLAYVLGILRISDPIEYDWFSNWMVIADAQLGLGTEKDRDISIFQGDTLKGRPFTSQDRIKVTIEGGMRKFLILMMIAPDTYIEPLVLLGYGWERNYNRKYGEIGLGLSIGENKDWYREYFKLRLYRRFNMGHNGILKGDEAFLNSWNAGVEVNLNWKMNKKQNQ